MFNQILVPLDGSKLAEAALPAASIMALALKAHVNLLHVIEQDAPEEIHRDRHLTDSNEALNYLETTARQNFPPGVKVDWHVHTAKVTDVARSITEHSTSEGQAALIILTSHGNSGLHDLFMGNIAQQVASMGESPVLLIKPSGAPEIFQIKRILVPLDDKSIHDQAIPIAESLSKAFHAQLDLLCVIPTLGTLSGEQAAAGNFMPTTTTAYLDIVEETAREHFQSHLDEFSRKGLSASATIVRGDPAPMIAKTGEKIQADLIILGTHGRAGLNAFWNRSVAASVARMSEIPLLLIPLIE
jgi:nucleotide-binding universal stress UspA family protein